MHKKGERYGNLRARGHIIQFELWHSFLLLKLGKWAQIFVTNSDQVLRTKPCKNTTHAQILTEEYMNTGHVAC